MELKTLHEIEQATGFSQSEMTRLGICIIFVVLTMIFSDAVSGHAENNIMLVGAAMIGAYMAMNIGANDVANNVGPAVGAKALTLTGAILIAAIFEAAGALIAGGDVVGTIRKGIISPTVFEDTQTFIWMMMAALLAGALWLNLATANNMPVSTTHSIVGGVLGAGVAAGGWDIVNWERVSAIGASWVISPLMGGIIAAAFLYLVKRSITYQEDRVASARAVVPILISLMAWAFSSYLILKGLNKIVDVGFVAAVIIGLGIAIATYLLVKPMVARSTRNLVNDKASLNTLFTVPLIFAAALLSFAHGANDVANAVGPLAAIHDAIMSNGVSDQTAIPIWIMVVGAVGIAIGLALYGPKLIRTVGSEITELDQMRAYCIAMAAAITVIVASQLGMPVSSTHTAIGAVFGIGLLREAIKVSYAEIIAEIRLHHKDRDDAEVEAYLDLFENASFVAKGVMLQELKKSSKSDVVLSKKDRKELRRKYGTELVKRSMALKIVSAWVITLPMSGIMGALSFFMLRGMFLP
ncbi:inorganic phosphate transporter [Pseudomonadota bacterium]